jgi:hypothetical protein
MSTPATTPERNPFIKAEEVSPQGTRVTIQSVTEINSPARPATFEKKATKGFHGLMVNILLEGRKLCLPVRHQSIDYNNVVSQMKSNDFWQWEGKELFVIRATTSAGSYVNVIRFDKNGMPELPNNGKTDRLPSQEVAKNLASNIAEELKQNNSARNLKQDQLIEALHDLAGQYIDQRSREALTLEAIARILKIALRM